MTQEKRDGFIEDMEADLKWKRAELLDIESGIESRKHIIESATEELKALNCEHAKAVNEIESLQTKLKEI